MTKHVNKRDKENEKTELVQKKWRKQRKAGKVQQALDGGGVQLGTSERPGRCQPSPLRKNIQVSMSIHRKYFEVQDTRYIHTTRYTHHACGVCLWVCFPGAWRRGSPGIFKSPVCTHHQPWTFSLSASHYFFLPEQA